MHIDPQRRGQLPPVDAPTTILGDDGCVRGWKVSLPGGRPLATPAVVNHRVFIGGGFGSYEFYSLAADDGRLLWQYQTSDDGPTAAVVEDDYVAFNTESCELEVLTAEGKSVWKHWLGDPLMSMPAMAGGKIFMAYPDTRGGGQHYLACFTLADGARLWQTPIAGEIITAPVLAEGNVYFATLDGTLYCCCQEDGHLLWSEASNATSSPVVVDGNCHFSQREEQPQPSSKTVQQTEHCASRESRRDAETRVYGSTRRNADYLDHDKRSSGSAIYSDSGVLDSAVGFASSKGSSKMHQAMKNLGHGHVRGVWAYQGSKPFYYRGRLYSSMGDTVCCVDAQTEQEVWKRKLHDDEQGELLDTVVTPPAVVNGKAFVCTVWGEILALCAETGEIVWQDRIDEPIEFQPAIVAGRVYIGTRAGVVVCLETGDVADDGWAMWGGTAAHNGLEAIEAESVATLV